MSDIEPAKQDPINDADIHEGSAELPPESLPPVEPPSAGFIIQLFVVPGLIVLAIVGVWALFGKMSSSEQDWQTLVTELRSSNEHRRWRGALGLAQMLKADADRGAESQQLARNPQVAQELTALLQEQLKSPSQTEDDLKQGAFVARTLGLIDVPDTVLPTLQEAMQPQYDREIRKNAIAAVALIAGRAEERNQPLAGDSILESVIDVSADPDPFVRQLGAYTLGLFPGEKAEQRLDVLLNDADGNTRINAAIGLTRRASTKGLPIFRKALSRALDAKPIGKDGAVRTDEQRVQDTAQLFERYIVVKNALKAVGDLSGHLTEDERREMIGYVESIAEKHPDSKLRIEATQALQVLRGSGE